MNRKRILITSPALNVQQNVSGISSLVSDLIANSRLQFVHLQLGSKDGTKRNIFWLLMQVRIYVKIFLLSIFRKYDLVHLNMGLEVLSIIRDSIVFFIVKKLFGKKVILHIHGGYYLMNESHNRIINFLLKKAFENAEHIIVLSDLEKKLLSNRYGDLSFNVFPNAVNLPMANNLSARPLHPMVQFVFMARINKSKGIYTITESLRYLESCFDKFYLEIYGAGPELVNWLASLKKYPALDFHYHGVVGGTDKWNALNNADVLLLPSISGEGMPIGMIEAMAVGTVVIATDSGSIKTVITDNVNGILIPENSPEQLAAKMKDVIEGRYDLKAIGQNAKQYVEAHLSLSSYINRLEDLYAAL